jgi:hypothetical protein
MDRVTKHQVAVCLFAVSAILSPAMAASWIGERKVHVESDRCDSWLANSASEAEGNSWILGNWSARTSTSFFVITAASGTEAATVLGDVKGICAAEPSTELSEAVARVYIRRYGAVR